MRRYSGRRGHTRAHWVSVVSTFALCVLFLILSHLFLPSLIHGSPEYDGAFFVSASEAYLGARRPLPKDLPVLRRPVRPCWRHKHACDIFHCSSNIELTTIHNQADRCCRIRLASPLPGCLLEPYRHDTPSRVQASSSDRSIRKGLSLYPAGHAPDSLDGSAQSRRNDPRFATQDYGMDIQQVGKRALSHAKTADLAPVLRFEKKASLLAAALKSVALVDVQA